MGIKHSTTKAGGEIGYASEWNANHVIDGDVDFVGYDALNVGNLTGTKYWSATGGAFIGVGAATNGVQAEGDIIPGAATTICPVMLPNGATITGVCVYGSDATNTWALYRGVKNDSVTLVNMASANHNTEDTTITSGVIDNSAYRYFIETTTGAGDHIYSAIIEYTI